MTTPSKLDEARLREAHRSEENGRRAVERLTVENPGDPKERYDYQISYYLEPTTLATQSPSRTGEG